MGTSVEVPQDRKRTEGDVVRMKVTEKLRELKGISIWCTEHDVEVTVYDNQELKTFTHIVDEGHLIPLFQNAWSVDVWGWCVEAQKEIDTEPYSDPEAIRRICRLSWELVLTA